MSPGTYTELFFLDEAVALAAGHRPCGECRRTQYRAFITAAADSNNLIGGAKDLDRLLNESRKQPRMTAPTAALPDGVFISNGDNDFRLLWAGALHRWSPGGYVDPVAIADLGTETAEAITPALTVGALRHGYPVEVHPSAITSALTDGGTGAPA